MGSPWVQHCPRAVSSCRCTAAAEGPHNFQHNCSLAVHQTDKTPIRGARSEEPGACWQAGEACMVCGMRAALLLTLSGHGWALSWSTCFLAVHTRLALHHYAVKSREEFALKMIRGSAMKRQRRAPGCPRCRAPCNSCWWYGLGSVEICFVFDAEGGSFLISWMSGPLSGTLMGSRCGTPWPPSGTTPVSCAMVAVVVLIKISAGRECSLRTRCH